MEDKKERESTNQYNVGAEWEKAPEALVNNMGGTKIWVVNCFMKSNQVQTSN